MLCLSLSGLYWAKKTDIFILGTRTIMTVDFYSPFKLLSLILIIAETQTVVHQEYQSSGTCHLTVNTLVTYFSMTNLTVTICQVTVFWKTNFLMWMMFLKKRLRPVELDVNKYEDWKIHIFLYSFFILHNHMISGELNVNCKMLIFTLAAS